MNVNLVLSYHFHYSNLPSPIDFLASSVWTDQIDKSMDDN